MTKKKKKDCAECRRLRKKLRNAEEREKILADGVNDLLLERRELIGKKQRSYERKL